MAEDTKAKKEPESTTQEAPMPSAEQKITSSEDEGAVSPQAKVTPQETKEEGLPEDVRERTKREFDKLQQQLRDERARRIYVESVFQSMQPQQQPEVQAPVYDPETGLVNEQVLTDVQRRAMEAEQRATRAEQAVQGYMEDQENRTAYAAYPELNPNNDSYNRTLHVATRRILTDSMLNPDDYGGRQLNFKEAADLAKGVQAEAVEEAKQEGAKQAIEQLTPKEQASLEAVGTPGRRTELASDLEELKYKTRKGDLDALSERLKRISEQE